MKYTIEVDDETIGFFRAYVDDCVFETEDLLARMLEVLRSILLETMRQ